jgi:hypothetical protein
MSWIEWLKEFSERGSHGESSSQARPPPHRGGTYSHEWVKVLEDNSRNADPADTYMWELGSDDMPVAQNRTPVDKVSPPESPLSETGAPFQTPADRDAADDPWGIKRDPPTRKISKEKGFNPYDTGVFDPDWTGGFDQR